jgi:hypothetical protein
MTAGDVRRVLSDRALATALGALLWAACALPLLLVRIPPYQDLPGHLAEVTVLLHPDRYPELAPTGLLKPGAFFFLWTLEVGRAVGIALAAKLFVLATLAANAFVLPRFVLHFTDRARMLLAAPLVLPMVHNWFVSMGMLGFAASVPAALALVVALDRQREAPTRRGALATGALACIATYLHPFPILVVALLAAAAIGDEIRAGRRLASPSAIVRSRAARAAAPLLPAIAVAAAFLVAHARHAAAGEIEPPVYSTVPWALYNLWGQWLYGFTELTAVTLLPAFVLGAAAALRWREGRGLLAPAPVALLLLAYLLGPYVALDANYVTPRLVPFLWAAALVRVPARLPRALVALLGGASVLYVAGMAIDLLRLARELEEVGAGVAAVPEGSRLLPLLFDLRPTSRNTLSLGTAWGLYVLERRTRAFDVWANVPSMPLVRRTPLPPHLEPMAKLRFVRSAATPERFCADRRATALVTTDEDCAREWRAAWDLFWARSLPELDHVLLWAPPAAVLATVPPGLTPVFARGRLHILARTP